MFRFFRTLRRNLIEEDNVRKYLWYAVGEVFLVVLGILIALQINNWNEQRQQRNEETRLLGNMVSDLDNDILQLEGIIADATIRQSKVDSVLHILYHEPDSEPMTFLLLTGQALGFENHFEVNSGTFDESQSAGSIKFIQNDDLRQEIFTYYRDTKRNYTDVNAVEQIYRDFFPTLFRKAIATKEALIAYKGVESTLPNVDIRKLGSDPDFIAILMNKGLSEQYQIESWEIFVDQAIALRDNINNELE